jgi:hypothetical protein
VGECAHEAGRGNVCRGRIFLIMRRDTASALCIDRDAANICGARALERMIQSLCYASFSFERACYGFRSSANDSEPGHFSKG